MEQLSLLGRPVDVNPEPYTKKPDWDEIARYYESHSIKETAKQFNIHPRVLCKKLDSNQKQGRRGVRNLLTMEQQVQIVYARTMFKISTKVLGRALHVAPNTIANIERRNKELKDLFEKCLEETRDKYMTHWKRRTKYIMETMDLLLEKIGKEETVDTASLKDLVEAWTKMHGVYADLFPKEQQLNVQGDEEARARLVDAIESAVAAKSMARKEAEGFYYQENPEHNENEENVNNGTEEENATS